MDEFKEYLRFPDIEKATEYTSVLDKHNIPFELDDASMRFKLVSTDSPWESQFILKIKDSDVERVEKVFESEIAKGVKELPPDHYLYTFADKDILDVIANQDEWTKQEVKLAIQIANERNINSSSQSVEVKIPEKESKRKITIEERSQKPKKLTTAITLLVLTFSTSIIYGIAKGVIKGITENQQKNFVNSSSHEPMHIFILFIAFFLLVGIPIFLLYKMNKGKNWARTIYSFITALSVLYFLLYFRYYLNQDLTNGIIMSIETILQIIALVLLYSKEVNDWYDFKNLKSEIVQQIK